MNKKVILGPASGASEHNVAKPFGLGCRVDGTSTRGKLVFLSGEALAVSDPLWWNAPPSATTMVTVQESAEGIVAI